MQEHIDSAKVVGGNINFLTIESGGNGILTEEFFRLEKQRTGAASPIYVDADFATIEKALSSRKRLKRA